jgi:hypothetical protein
LHVVGSRAVSSPPPRFGEGPGEGLRTALILCALIFFSSSAAAEERSPEHLLPPTTQIYARWDGVAAHREAYANSARGKMFAGESGRALDTLLDKLARQVKLSLVGEPLLGGTPPQELLKVHADVKALLNLPKLLTETGIVAGFEIRPPAYDLGTLYALIRGDAKARERLQEPTFQLTVVIPNAGDRGELRAALRLLQKAAKGSVKEQEILGRKVTIFDKEGEKEFLAAWSEGKHFVLALANSGVERAVARVKDAGAGITEHPLYKKLGAFKEFRVVTRGFLDVGGTVKSFERLAQAAAPEVWAIVEHLGLTGIGSACLWDGFDGEESRGIIEIAFTGERRGLTRLFRPAGKDGPARPAPLTLKDLPPLPADLTRFAAARLDAGAVFNLGLVLLPDFGGEAVDDEGKKLSPTERLRQKQEQSIKTVDDELGFKTADLFGALDDRAVTYHAPSDGLPGIGQVIVLGVRDEKTLRRCLDILTRRIEGTARKEVVVRKRDCAGVEVREFVVKAKSPVTVAYAVCDGWLVIGLQPQPVRGFVLRAKGKLPVWKPDERTAATLAKLPADTCVLQVADPRPTLTWLLSGAPILAGLFGVENNKEPLIDPGLFPHPGEACKQLFPNVMWCRDDGRTMRWESRDSLWLPLEAVGLETVAGIGALLSGL